MLYSVFQFYFYSFSPCRRKRASFFVYKSCCHFNPGHFPGPPPHTGGDPDFDTSPDNWANRQIQSEMRVNGNLLERRLFYDVMEFGGNNTRVGVNGDGEASAWSNWTTIFTNDDPNYHLVGFSLQLRQDTLLQ